jgi:hypothetical protein
MRILKKASIMKSKRNIEHVNTERHVFQTLHDAPFLVKLQYAFTWDERLHVVVGENVKL